MKLKDWYVHQQKQKALKRFIRLWKIDPLRQKDEIESLSKHLAEINSLDARPVLILLAENDLVQAGDWYSDALGGGLVQVRKTYSGIEQRVGSSSMPHFRMLYPKNFKYNGFRFVYKRK